MLLAATSSKISQMRGGTCLLVQMLQNGSLTSLSVSSQGCLPLGQFPGLKGSCLRFSPVGVVDWGAGLQSPSCRCQSAFTRSLACSSVLQRKPGKDSGPEDDAPRCELV